MVVGNNANILPGFFFSQRYSTLAFSLKISAPNLPREILQFYRTAMGLHNIIYFNWLRTYSNRASTHSCNTARNAQSNVKYDPTNCACYRGSEIDSHQMALFSVAYHLVTMWRLSPGRKVRKHFNIFFRFTNLSKHNSCAILHLDSYIPLQYRLNTKLTRTTPFVTYVQSAISPPRDLTWGFHEAKDHVISLCQDHRLISFYFRCILQGIVYGNSFRPC